MARRPTMDADYGTPYGGQGYPVNTAVYDLTGYGDIDDEKSELLRRLLKADPRGAATIATYTNRLSADPMTKYLNPGGPINVLRYAQDQYINERSRVRKPMTYRQAKSLGG